MPAVTLSNAITGASVLVMTVATVFMGVVATKTYDLSEDFGRLDSRVGTVESTLSNTAKTLDDVKTQIELGFKGLNQRFDRIDVRLGHMELSPEMLLAEQGVKIDKDLNAFFYGGHIYAVAKSQGAEALLKQAGYHEEVLGGFLRAYLLVQDAVFTEDTPE